VVSRYGPITVSFYVMLFLFAALVAPLILPSEKITPRAAAAGLAIFTGLGFVILSELRHNREIPVEPVGE
jgi:drug/metabolite transporter (DMT)-like permease